MQFTSRTIVYMSDSMDTSEPPVVDDLTELLNPEILSDSQLINILQRYHVEVSAHAPRGDLLQLFIQTIQPKPQRAHREDNGRRDRRRSVTIAPTIKRKL